MFLLSLTATCQVWALSLKAGLYTYKPLREGRGIKRRAPQAERCYDFPCQELATDFLGVHDVFVLGASEKPEPVRSDG
jgi:hypothetical protein